MGIAADLLYPMVLGQDWPEILQLLQKDLMEVLLGEEAPEEVEGEATSLWDMTFIHGAQIRGMQHEEPAFRAVWESEIA